jgi:hypothetical protein
MVKDAGPKTELDRPFDDQINDGQDYLPRLDGLLKREKRKNLVEWQSFPRSHPLYCHSVVHDTCNKTVGKFEVNSTLKNIIAAMIEEFLDGSTRFTMFRPEQLCKQISSNLFWTSSHHLLLSGEEMLRKM